MSLDEKISKILECTSYKYIWYDDTNVPPLGIKYTNSAYFTLHAVWGLILDNHGSS